MLKDRIVKAEESDLVTIDKDLKMYSFENGQKASGQWILEKIKEMKKHLQNCVRRSQKRITFHTSTGDTLILLNAHKSTERNEENLYYVHFIIATTAGYCELLEDFIIYDEKHERNIIFRPI